MGLVSNCKNEGVGWTGELQTCPLPANPTCGLFDQISEGVASSLFDLLKFWTPCLQCSSLSLGICSADRTMSLERAHNHKALARSVNWGDTVPPMLLM